MRADGSDFGTAMFYLVDRGEGKVLCVPDVDNEKEFVKNARKEWREAHPGTSKKRGRRPLEDLIIRECVAAAGERLLRQQDSLGKICRVVRERFTAKGENPHDDTIRKYAKAWKNDKIVVMVEAGNPMDINLFLVHAIPYVRSGFYPWRIYLRKMKKE